MGRVVASYLRIEGTVVHYHGVTYGVIVLAALTSASGQNRNTFIGLVVLVQLIKDVEFSCVELLLIEAVLNVDMAP